MAVEIVEALPGMEVGKGFDNVSHDVKISPAVTGKIGVSPGATGQAGGFNLVIVRGSSEFSDSLNVSASAGGGFGPFSGSAKASFQKRCRVSREATFCILSYHATNALESFHGEPKLSEEAEELLRLGETERFQKRFGNRFVSGRYTGGEFFGSIRIESETEERQAEIGAEISASFGVFSASGSVDKKTSERLGKEKIEIMTMQTGGDIIPVFTLAQLFERAKEVARQVAGGHASPISVTLETYDELKLPTDDVSAIEQMHARTVMRSLRKDYDKLLELQNDIDFVLRHQDYYVKVDVGRLNAASKQITHALNEIVERADRCSRDFSQCELFSPTIPAIRIPERRRKAGRRGARRPALLQRSKRLEREARLLGELSRHLPPGPRKRRMHARVTRLERRAGRLEQEAREAKKTAAKTKAAKKVAAKEKRPANRKDKKEPAPARARAK